MKTETYQVEIPKVLTSLAGPQKVRCEIEYAVRRIFEGWAKDALLENISCVKPRTTPAALDQAGTTPAALDDAA